MDFDLDIDDLVNGLADFDDKMKVAISIYADAAGEKLEAEAKDNAPWTDRTGLSRETIEGGNEWDGDECYIYVAGNTDYFPFLELCHDKKYATLKPSLDKLSPEIIKGMENLLRK